jgi:hypothetical protein
MSERFLRVLRVPPYSFSNYFAVSRTTGHCGFSAAGELDLLAGVAEPAPRDDFLAEINHIPARIAKTIKANAATMILLKCRRAGRSPTLAFEVIMTEWDAVFAMN